MNLQRRRPLRTFALLLALTLLPSASAWAEESDIVVEMEGQSASSVSSESSNAPAPMTLAELPSNAILGTQVKSAVLALGDGGSISGELPADARLRLDYTLALPAAPGDGAQLTFALPPQLVYTNCEAARAADGSYALAPRTQYEVLQNGMVVGACAVDPAAKTATVTFNADAAMGEAALSLSAGLDGTQDEATRVTTINFPEPAAQPPVQLTVMPAYFSFLSAAHLYDASKFDAADPAHTLVPFDKNVDNDAVVLLAYSYLIPDRAADALFPVQPGIRYHFALPKQLTLPPDVNELDFTVTEGALTIADVHISADTAADCGSYLVFRPVEAGAENHFDPQKYSPVDAPENPGLFLFTGQFDADGVGTGGKQKVPFQVHGVTVGTPEDVYFNAYDPKAKVELTKDGKADLSQLRLDWTLTAKAEVQFGEAVSKLVITDTIGQDPAQAYDGSQTVAVTDASGNTVPAAVSYSGTDNTLTIAITGDVHDGDVYTIQYYTTFALSAITKNTFTFQNTAKADYESPHYVLDDDGQLKADTPTPHATAPVTKQVDVAGDFVKKVTGPWNAKSVGWTVTLNEHGFLLAAPTFADTLPAGLKLDDGSLKLTVNEGTQQTLTAGNSQDSLTDYQYYYDFTDDDTASTLTVKLPAGLKDQLELAYSTTAKESFWQDNENHVLKNTVAFDIGNGPIPAEATATIKAAHLLGKSAGYDPRTHAFTYRVQANTSDHYALSGVTITDTLPAGLTLALADKSGPAGLAPGALTPEQIDTVFAFGASSVRPDAVSYGKDGAGRETLTFTFNGTMAAAESMDVSFSALVDDPNLWAVNLTDGGLKDTFNTGAGRNEAKMTATLDGQQKTYTVTAGAPITSTVVAKAGLPQEYDAAAHSAKWRIVLNQNQMRLTEPVVVDTLANGQTYDAAKAQLAVYRYDVGASGAAQTRAADPTGGNFGVTATPSVDGKTVTFAFPGVLDCQYALEFYTQAGQETLDALLAQSAGGTVSVENTAVLQPGAEVPAAQQVTAPQNIGQGMVEKTAEVTPGQSYIDWRVAVNKNLLALDEFRLNDTLPAGLRLDMAHVAFYRLEDLAVNGGVTPSTQRVPVALPAGAVTTDPEGKTLSFAWDEPITDAYELVFRTDLTDPSGKFDGENAITLNGVSAPLGDGSGQVHQAVAGGGGVWLPPQYAVCTLKKVDAATGLPLPGAAFQLAGGAVYADTDNDGEVEIPNLKVGTSYTVTEVTAPQGYLLDQTPIVIKPEAAGTFVQTVKNHRRAGSFVLQKQNSAGQALDGAQFELYQKDAAGGDTGLRTLALTGGSVTVPDLVPGVYYFREKTAPADYALDVAEYTLTVAVDTAAPDTAPGVTMAVTAPGGAAAPLAAANGGFAYAVKNKVLGKLTVTKIEAGDPAEVLAGAVLALYEQDAAGAYVPVGVPQTTGQDGTAVFTGLVEGVQYYVQEQTSPAGYQLDKTYVPLTDTVALGALELAQTLENAPRLGAVTVEKKDALNGMVLAGAQFAVYRAGQDPAADAPRGAITTDQTGRGTLDGLRTGGYFLVETAAPAGYLLDARQWPFAIEDDGDTGTRVSVGGTALTGPLTVPDQPCTGAVTLEKQNTKGTPLAGARFCVYQKDANGSVDVATRRFCTTGTDGTATLDGLRPGSYYYAEDAAPAGYLVDGQEHAFTIALDAGQATGAAHVREAPVVDLRRGALAIHKQDAATGEPLSGAAFAVYEAGREAPLFTGATDGSGLLMVPDTVVLREGAAYTVREVTPPQGYLADAEAQSFAITPDEPAVTLIFADTAEPADSSSSVPPASSSPVLPDSAPPAVQESPSATTAPQTGDLVLTALFALLAAGVLLLTALLFAWRRGRK